VGLAATTVAASAKATTSSTDTPARAVSWTLNVTAFPQLDALVHARARGGLVRLVAGVRGGDGHLLAAHWRIPGRGTFDGTGSIAVG
jgi:hypothetical protein